MRRFLRWSIFVLTISLWGALGLGQDALGESKTPSEYALKAAFLYNFSKFVDWPDEAFVDDQSPIILCILGKDPFGDILKSIEGRTVKGRRLTIRRSKEIEYLEQCHILYISGSQERDLTQIFERLTDWHVLTVSDMESFAQRGGIIGLLTEKDKIHFEINVKAAKRSGVKISSKLLNLAHIVGNEDT
jgi:hypothetical protein